jgi:hypothetical protein
MRYVAGALCALLWPGVVYAETLEPRAVQYDFEEKQDSTTKSCNVILTLLSMPAPEVVKFTFTEVSGNGVSAPIAVGFYLDVGDFQFANGKPASIQRAKLRTAAFLSTSFNTPGRFYTSPQDDGSVFVGTGNPDDAGPFILAFGAGDFTLSFQRDGPEVSRAYHVKDRPPLAVSNKLLACSERAFIP